MIVITCLKKSIPAIAYTYNEPTVFVEYFTDIARLVSTARACIVLDDLIRDNDMPGIDGSVVRTAMRAVEQQCLTLCQSITGDGRGAGFVARALA